MASILLRGGVRLGNIIQHEYGVEIGHCRETVTVNDAAGGAYVIGQVLGKVTATGKYTVLNPAATDGSENFAGIFIGQDGQLDPDHITVAAATDTPVVVLWRGPVGVGKKYLLWPAGITDTQKTAAYAQMEAVGFKVEEQI